LIARRTFISDPVSISLNGLLALIFFSQLPGGLQR
jgi:hypothetical protein